MIRDRRRERAELLLKWSNDVIPEAPASIERSRDHLRHQYLVVYFVRTMHILVDKSLF
jgi:hypothetical protein